MVDTAPARAAIRTSHDRRRGADVERREGSVAQPERRVAGAARPTARLRALPRPDRRRRRGRAAPAGTGGGRRGPVPAPGVARPIRSSTSTSTSAVSPSPLLGSQRQLLDLVAAIYQDPYDRTRPLWTFHVIEGLDGGGGALVWKIHHTVADGTGAGRLAEGYIQPTRQAPDPPDVDLDAIVALAVAEAEQEAPGRVPQRRRRASPGASPTPARRQAGIARRVLGELGMWGADPLRARDAATGAVAPCARWASSSSAGTTSPRTRTTGRVTAEDRRCGANGPATATSSCCASRSTPPWRRPGGWAVRSTTGSSPGVVNGAVALPRRPRHPADVAADELHRQHPHRTAAIGGNSFTPSRLSVPAGPMEPAARFAEISARDAGQAGRRQGPGPAVGDRRSGQPAADVGRHRIRPGPGARSRTSPRRTCGVPNGASFISGARVDGNHPSGRSPARRSTSPRCPTPARFDMGLFVDPVAVEDPAGLRDDISAAYDELIAIGSA